MGKYKNSEIHAKYSDWHYTVSQYNPEYKRLYMSDIDRLWCEYDYKSNAVVAIIDIKWADSGDGMTATEKGVYEWFRNKGVNYYIVFINKGFTEFTVQNNRGDLRKFNEIEYADWLLSLRTIRKK